MPKSMMFTNKNIHISIPKRTAFHVETSNTNLQTYSGELASLLLTSENTDELHIKIQLGGNTAYQVCSLIYYIFICLASEI